MGCHGLGSVETKPVPSTGMLSIEFLLNHDSIESSRSSYSRGTQSGSAVDGRAATPPHEAAYLEATLGPASLLAQRMTGIETDKYDVLASPILAHIPYNNTGPHTRASVSHHSNGQQYRDWPSPPSSNTGSYRRSSHVTTIADGLATSSDDYTVCPFTNDLAETNQALAHQKERNRKYRALNGEGMHTLEDCVRIQFNKCGVAQGASNSITSRLHFTSRSTCKLSTELLLQLYNLLDKMPDWVLPTVGLSETDLQSLIETQHWVKECKGKQARRQEEAIQQRWAWQNENRRRSSEKVVKAAKARDDKDAQLRQSQRDRQEELRMLEEYQYMVSTMSRPAFEQSPRTRLETNGYRVSKASRKSSPASTKQRRSTRTPKL